MTHKITIDDRVSIVKRGKRGFWTALYRDNGRTRRRSLKTPNLQVARNRAVALAAQIASNTHLGGIATRMTVGAAIDQFLYEKEHTEQRKHRTMLGYKRKVAILREACKATNVKYVTDLKPATLQYIRNRYTGVHHPTTIYNTSIVIKQFGNWAETWQLVPRSPFHGLRFPKPRNKPKFILTTAQVHSILNTVSGERRVQLAVLAFTGMRVGELQHLRQQDVDLTANFINIVAQQDWTPKTVPARRIPIHPVLKSFLLTMPGKKRPYFFESETNPVTRRVAPMLNPKSLLVHFQSVAKSIGLPVRRISGGLVIHSLRDFFETTCVNAGVPQFVIDIWMGHAHNKAMGRTYFGLHDTESHSHMAKVSFNQTLEKGA